MCGRVLMAVTPLVSNKHARGAAESKESGIKHRDFKVGLQNLIIIKFQ